MGENNRFCLEICKFCELVRFGEVKEGIGFDGIDSLIDSAEILEVICSDCIERVRDEAKRCLREVFLEEKEIERQSKTAYIKVVK
ncbi:MAG: hypothetical protein L3J07_02615 [Candidatus Magasanikbacteria bacterium]|nr:hypothetical protein [Candidatus Magasanikbacteria bacterium]